MEEDGSFETMDIDLDEIGGIEGLKRMRPGKQVLKRREKMYLVLSSHNRIEILFFLNFIPLTPGDLSIITGMAPNLLSFHLKKLERAGLIKGKRDGKQIIYSITDIGRSLSGPLTK
jgi:DNA-binding transcriptional ArsR family regulator